LPKSQILCKIIPASAIPIVGAWCNGSTPDFESVDLGSNPSAPAFLFNQDVSKTGNIKDGLCSANLAALARFLSL
jgi:hypothetical protein